MKVKTSTSILNDYHPKIPPELEKETDRLIDRTQVEFKDVHFDRLEALAVRDDFRDRFALVFRDDLEGYCWHDLIIFDNPLIGYRKDFVALNPNRQGTFSQTFLYTLDGISIYRDSRSTSWEIPSLRERLNGMRTKENRFNEYFFELKKYLEREVKDDDLVIPIYEGDDAYTRIMSFIKRSKR